MKDCTRNKCPSDPHALELVERSEAKTVTKVFDSDVRAHTHHQPSDVSKKTKSGLAPSANVPLPTSLQLQGLQNLTSPSVSLLAAGQVTPPHSLTETLFFYWFCWAKSLKIVCRFQKPLWPHLFYSKGSRTLRALVLLSWQHRGKSHLRIL